MKLDVSIAITDEDSQKYGGTWKLTDIKQLDNTLPYMAANIAGHIASDARLNILDKRGTPEMDSSDPWLENLIKL